MAGDQAMAGDLFQQFGVSPDDYEIDAAGTLRRRTATEGDDPWQKVLEQREVESGLVTLARSHKKKKALEIIDEIAPPPEPVKPEPVKVAETAPPEDEAAAAAAAREAAAARTATAVASPARTQAPGSGAGAVTKDVARGATEAPRQILGGMRDAAQAALNLGDWLADNLESVAPLGGFQLFNEKGEFAPDRIPAGDPRLAPAKTGVTLPAVKQPTTVTGGVVRGVSQFLTGFVAAGAVLGPAGAALGTVPRGAVQGALADFTAFDAHDKRLSDLVQEFPALQNPVTAFMASKPGDGEAEGRFKRALEGLGLGVATVGMIQAVKYLRDARRAAAAADPEQAAARAAAEPVVPPPNTLLGDETGPLVARQSDVPKKAAADKTLPADSHGVPDDVLAKSLTAKGLTPLTEGADPVFINFGRMKTTQDVIQALTDMATAFKGDIDAARRGVRSNRVTLMASGKEDAWKVLTERRRGDALNAEQSVAARRLWETSGEKLIEVAEVASATPTAENLLAFRQMMAIHSEIQSQVIAARTETARSLQSWQIPVGGTGKARLASIENLLTTYGGAEASSMLARKVASLKNLPEGAGVLDDVVARGAFGKSIDVAKEVWVNALLSNPKTHIVNVMGNTISLMQELVERMAAGAYSRAIGSGAIAPGEAAAKAFALSQGMREGFWLAGKALRTGESQFGAATTKTAETGFERAISSGHLGADPDAWFGRAVDGIGNVVNMPVRFLTAEDDFFKAIAYRTEVAAQAARQASKEVADGALPKDLLKARAAELMRDPPESITMGATDYARYMTYTNEPGAFVQAVNRLDRTLMASDNPAAQASSLAMRILIPFRNTPANLVNYAFERTPLAPLMARYREAIARGGAEADIARTRMALGTMTMLTVMDLALDGHVTGAGPKGEQDRGTRDTLQRAGWQPYSVRIGDRYFSYKRTDPFGIMLGIAGDVAELVNNAAMDEDKREQIFELVAAASASFGNQMLDKTYMASVSDLIDVLHKPNRASGFIERRAASFEPAIAGEARRQVDPYMRYTHDLVTEIRNKTPGLSDALPLARDVWGRPKTFQSGMGMVYDAISPIASRKFDPEPIDREAIANDFNIAPPAPMLTFGIGLTVSLRNRPEVLSRYLELRGTASPADLGADVEATLKSGQNKGKHKWRWGSKPLLDTLNDIVSGKHPLSDEYQDASGGRNGGRDKLITKAIADYGRLAKARILKEFPDVVGAIERKAAGRGATPWTGLAGEEE